MIMRVYKAMDVAKYVIYYCIEHDIPISNLKLQKLLYFIQAIYLVQLKVPCFNDEIQAWDFGPVVPNVYHKFKQYGAGNIPYVNAEIYDVGNKIDDKDKKRIAIILEGFAHYRAIDLVKATHEQDPWKNVYQKGQHNISISNQSIRNYFEKVLSAKN